MNPEEPPAQQSPAPELIDSHAHLDQKPFQGRLEEVLEHARRAGVTRVLQVGTEPPSWERSLALAGRHPELSVVLGLQVHACTRHGASTLDLLARTIEAARERVVGLGETGLDFHYDYPREAQFSWFRLQLGLARRLKLPVVIHTREAEAETLALLREDADQAGAPLRGLIHCFSAGPDFATDCLALGLDLSFSGSLTFPGSGPIAEAAALAPWDRIHIETDSPYLAPVPVRGVRPNEPGFLRHTARFLAELRGVSEAYAAKRTRENTRRLFGLAD